jgi:hypothetical protein
MIASIIYAVGGFIETLIGLRIVLRLIGANASNGIVNWVYSWSTPFVTPFSGIFGQDATVVTQLPGAVVPSVFDWTAIIALVFIGLAIGLVGVLFGRRPAYGARR